MQEEQKEPREEQIFWEKVKEKVKEWKVTIGMAGSILLVMIGVGIFALVNWMTGMVRAGGFSAEVDAAMIQAMVAICVAVPATLLTGAGTILVTAHFNRQTQKLAIQAQRSAIRDKILEKRMEIYPELEKRLSEITETVKFAAKERIDKNEPLIKAELLYDYYDNNKKYISNSLRTKIEDFLSNAFRTCFHLSDDEAWDYYMKVKNSKVKAIDLINKELDLNTIDQDWKYLQQTRIDQEAAEETKKMPSPPDR